ncbi:hypothetical protein O7631_11480 [Micromonospora sp. WMMD967]|uniref:hypothetical protein n=1 Tax=Micromonospora sp. WMMD967 TaxID=3016101 RepID=UPI002416EC1A|nr:hypothetical protein [Micromonospora sp. WMMD967]MDG4837136.1 hypothetical protein [Micromonospora sp. WMMD967]
MLVAAGLVVGLPALTLALFVLDGRETTPRGVLTIFLLTLLFAALGAGMALLASHRLPDPKAARTADRTVRQALRAGHADDPRIDSLARREAEHRIRGRWVLWLLGAGVLIEALLLVGASRPSTRLVAVVLGVLWTVQGYLRWRDLREARRYLASHHDALAPPGADERPAPTDGSVEAGRDGAVGAGRDGAVEAGRDGATASEG